jgi:hypothetical protein
MVAQAGVDREQRQQRTHEAVGGVWRQHAQAVQRVAHLERVNPCEKLCVSPVSIANGASCRPARCGPERAAGSRARGRGAGRRTGVPPARVSVPAQTPETIGPTAPPRAPVQASGILPYERHMPRGTCMPSHSLPGRQHAAVAVRPRRPLRQASSGPARARRADLTALVRSG